MPSSCCSWKLVASKLAAVLIVCFNHAYSAMAMIYQGLQYCLTYNHVLIRCKVCKRVSMQAVELAASKVLAVQHTSELSCMTPHISITTWAYGIIQGSCMSQPESNASSVQEESSLVAMQELYVFTAFDPGP